MFGELSLFDPGPRTATATAVAETQLLGLGHEDLHALLDGRPAVASALLAALARRLRRTNENLADLVFTDVPGRVAKALLDLSDRFGRPAEDGILVAHDLTQEELAQLVGASRETVNKALADFAARGWLRARGPRRRPARRRAAQAPRPLTAAPVRRAAAPPAGSASGGCAGSPAGPATLSRAAGHTSRGTSAYTRSHHRVGVRRRTVGHRLPHLLEPLAAVLQVERAPRRPRPAATGPWPGRMVVTCPVAGQLRQPLQ